MHCNILKIQDGVAIVEKLNCNMNCLSKKVQTMRITSMVSLLCSTALRCRESIVSNVTAWIQRKAF